MAVTIACGQLALPQMMGTEPQTLLTWTQGKRGPGSWPCPVLCQKSKRFALLWMLQTSSSFLEVGGESFHVPHFPPW